MSDTSQGPGWWQASDGKWYAPELYPKDWEAPAGGDVGATASEVADSLGAELPASGAVQVGDSTTSGLPVDESSSVEPATPAEWSEPAAVPPTPEVPIAAAGSASPSWEPPPLMPEDPAVSVAPTPELSEPPSGWSPPGPATADPTLVEGVPAVSAQDPTMVQPAVVPPVSSPPIASDAGQAGWNAPSAPATPPSSWETPSAAPFGAAQAGAAATDDEPTADVPGGLLAFLGGAGLIVGSFLDWAVAGGTLTSGSVNGLTGSNGWGTLISGLVVASCGGLLLAGQRKSWVAGLMTAAALVGLGLAIFSYVDIGSTSDDLAGLLRSAEPPVSDEVANGAVLDYDLGMWIVLGGGAVSLLAGVVAFVRRQ